VRRIVDDELDELLEGVSAISLDGAKAVGKTLTASQRAHTTVALDDAEQRALLEADPTLLIRGNPPTLVDEWQRAPESWDLVRRAVDVDSSPGRFLLTGSASPSTAPTHSGAGRIVSVRMRPMSLAERGIERPAVSIRELLSGRRPDIGGDTSLTWPDYAELITTSGFPGVRHLRGRALRAQLDGYLARVVDTDVPLAGRPLRNPAGLRRWMAAYAAATATTATFETLRDAATGGEGDKPARSTTGPYREVLERMWLLDPVPAWTPSENRLTRLGSAPKHHLVDPALAARLLAVDADAIAAGTAAGALFESLLTQSLRVYAQAAEATVGHLRERGGNHEIDLVVERADGRVLAIEVKLGRSVTDEDVRHLRWLRERLGDRVLDRVVVTAGQHAYRRPDGVAVVPAALLGA
jgi:predicted AAA+ superfamily ATPase